MSDIVRKIRKSLLRLTPPEHHQRFAEIKNFFSGGYRQIHYSQFGEDIVLDTLFKKRSSGFFVDVGAHHPRRYSNTYLFYRRGWKRINIEPNPSAIRLFKRVRRNDTNLCVAISSKKPREGRLTYYIYSDPAMNTLSGETAELLKGKKWLKLLRKSEVEVRTLSEVLRSYVPAGQSIDFLSIDTEGFDLDVLRSNDWSRFHPTVLVVESHGFTPEAPNDSEVFRELKSHGYILSSYVGPTLIFIDPAKR